LFLTNEGWKSFNPEKSMIEAPSIKNIQKLKKGDKLGKIVIEKIDCIKSKDTIDVYSLDLEGEQTHFANGFPVHSMADYSIDDLNETKILNARLSKEEINRLKNIFLQNNETIVKIFGKYKTERLIKQINIE
jgi:hypothetical protein